jgi:integrase
MTDKITEKSMRAKPGKTDLWIVEDGARGEGRLVGRIAPGGERRFYYRYTAPGRAQVRLPLGPYDAHGNGCSAFTVQQARDKARGWSALYRGGIHDLREYLERQRVDEQQAQEDARRTAEAARAAAEKEAQAAALDRERRITVRALFERWAATELRPHKRADGKRAGRIDGGNYVRDQFGRHVFPTLGDRAVADTSKADILGILDRVKAAGKLRTANMLLADLKQMFAFAADREIIPHCPIVTLKKAKIGGKDTERERVLSPEQIKLLPGKIAAANMNKRTVAAIWLLLSTGARVGELMGAVWAGPGVDLHKLVKLPSAAAVKVGIVDTLARTWHLPTTKNQREHTIHLSKFALIQIDVLAGLRASLLNSAGFSAAVPWLFPNDAGTGPVNVKSFGRQLADRQRTPERRMTNRATKTDSLALPGGRWTAHDLRRTAGTLMASLGVSGDVIDECLNHIIASKVRRTYIRDRRPIEQARAFDALGERLTEIITGAKAPPNVVALRAA